MGEKIKLRGCVVGCRMGRAHAAAMASLDQYDLVALCDLDRNTAESVADRVGNPAVFCDYTEMLEAVKPDVVAIATPTNSHAALTIQAMEFGVRGVYCEKPMATNMADARRMVELAGNRGIALAVNHQRRISPVYHTVKHLIENDEIGEISLIRGSCAGDVLSDGTHTIDTMLHITGDSEIGWVFGQVYRDPPDPNEPRSGGYHASGGWRYGHIIESGAMAIIQFKSGVRGELFTGGARIPNRNYQDVEIFGSGGRIWIPGDESDPPLLIQKDSGWKPLRGDELEVPEGFRNPITYGYLLFARTIATGSHHPLCGENSLRGFEAVMAVYESARLRDKISLPPQQEKFPLDLMWGENRA